MIPADKVLGEDKPKPKKAHQTAVPAAVDSSLGQSASAAEASATPEPATSEFAKSQSDGAIRMDPVTRAIAEIAAGRCVVVVDDEDRENEGDLIFAAAGRHPNWSASWFDTPRGSSASPCQVRS